MISNLSLIEDKETLSSLLSSSHEHLMKVPNTSIEVQVVGKRLNRGGGYGLEIPVIVFMAKKNL